MLTKRLKLCVSSYLKIRKNSNVAGLSGQPRDHASIGAKQPENFEDLLSRRQSEVERTIIVKLENLESSSNVYHYCKQFGEIRNAIAYPLKGERNYLLIEYENEEAVLDAFKYCGFHSNAPPWINQYITLRKSSLIEPNSNDAPIQLSHVQEPSVVDILKNAESIEEQISLLYQHTCINDTLTRLKFIGAMQAQRIVNFFMPTVFPNAKIFPFGSTLNGYGRMGSDLDMALRCDEMEEPSKINCDSALKFHTRICETDNDMRKINGRQVKCMAAMIDHYLPASKMIRYIAGARVPLVTYYDTNIPCSVDLSVDNLNGFADTQLMYTLGVIDARVRPFIFLVRRWAKEFKITRHGRGDCFTNFQLSFIALSFLQNLNEPVIPTFNDMIQMMNTCGTKTKEDFKNQFFMFNLNQIQFQSKNSSTVFELFCQFLEYYGTFDFSNSAITLATAGKMEKPTSTPLYLDNLFDSEKACGDNISRSELKTLQIMMQETLGELETINLKSDGTDEWGLLWLLTHLKK